MNKKASVGDFLTEFIAFIIIFGISIGLVTSSLAIASGRSVPLIGEGRDKIILNSEKVKVKENLINILNSEVDSEKMINVILNSLNGYFDTKSLDASQENLVEKFGIENLDKISPLNTEKEGFDKEEIIRLKNEEVALAEKIVDSIECEEFYLKIPQGIITEKGLMAGGFDSGKISEWGGEVNMKFYYKNYNFEIKFKQLKKC